MSALDWLILAAVAVLFVLAVRFCWRRRGKCCGDCTACGHCGHCSQQNRQ